MLAGEQLDHLRQHHSVDLADQPVALGRGQEPARRDQLAAGVVGEPYERLVVGDLAVAQRHDRLVVQDERTLRVGRGAAARATAAGASPRARTSPAGVAVVRRRLRRAQEQAGRRRDRRGQHGLGFRRRAPLPCANVSLWSFSCENVNKPAQMCIFPSRLRDCSHKEGDGVVLFWRLRVTIVLLSLQSVHNISAPLPLGKYFCSGHLHLVAAHLHLSLFSLFISSPSRP